MRRENPINRDRDISLEELLDLDGQILVDEHGGYWVKFEVRQVITGAGWVFFLTKIGLAHNHPKDESKFIGRAS